MKGPLVVPKSGIIAVQHAEQMSINMVLFNKDYGVLATNLLFDYPGTNRQLLQHPEISLTVVRWRYLYDPSLFWYLFLPLSDAWSIE